MQRAGAINKLATQQHLIRPHQFISANIDVEAEQRKRRRQRGREMERERKRWRDIDGGGERAAGKEREENPFPPKKCDFPYLATTALTCLLVDTPLPPPPLTLSFSATHSPTDGETQAQREGEIQSCSRRKACFLWRKLPHWCARLYVFRPPVRMCMHVCMCACVHMCGAQFQYWSVR